MEVSLLVCSSSYSGVSELHTHMERKKKSVSYVQTRSETQSRELQCKLPFAILHSISHMPSVPTEPTQNNVTIRKYNSWCVLHARKIASEAISSTASGHICNWMFVLLLSKHRNAMKYTFPYRCDSKYFDGANRNNHIRQTDGLTIGYNSICAGYERPSQHTDTQNDQTRTCNKTFEERNGQKTVETLLMRSTASAREISGHDRLARDLRLLMRSARVCLESVHTLRLAIAYM